MAQEDEPLEDIAANLLTGAMVLLLAAAAAVAGVWMVASRPHIWTAFPDMDTLFLGSMAASAVYLGFSGMRWGLRMIRIHLTRLQRRRGRRSPSI